MKKSRPYQATLIKGHVRNRLVKKIDRTKRHKLMVTYGIDLFRLQKYNKFFDCQ